MLRNLGNPSDKKVALAREIAEARDAGLELQDLLKALVVNFPEAPLRAVLAAWEALQPANVGPPSPGRVLRAIYGAETTPPAALDDADPRITILQKVALGRELCSTPETIPQGMLCMFYASYEALRYVGATQDSLVPLRQYIVAKSGGGDGQWGAQTFLALSLECHLRLGEKLGVASRNVIAAFNGPKSWLGLYSRPDRTLQEWHKHLRLNYRVPRTGEHRQIYTDGMRVLDAISELNEPERETSLRLAAEDFRKMARSRLSSLFS